MERDCHSMEIAVSMRAVYPRELTYVEETMLTHQLVSIAVISQLMLSMMILTSQWETQSMWDCILAVEVNAFVIYLLRNLMAKEDESNYM